MKEISIIVPVYNTEKFLERCLDSIINQSIIGKIKIIVVIDGSPDNSLDIIKKFYSKHPNEIEYYNKKNSGISSTRNFGISKCSTKYIGFVDSDDYIDKYMYENLYTDIEKNNSDISACGIIKCNNEGSVISYEGIKVEGVFSSKQIIDMVFRENVGCYAWNKLYKYDLFKENEIEYPVGRLYEDIITTIILFDKSKIISFISKPLYYYVQHKKSICYNAKLQMALDMLLNLEDISYIDNNKSIFIANTAVNSLTTYCRSYLNGSLKNEAYENIKAYKLKIKLFKKQVKIKYIFDKELLMSKKVKIILLKINLLKPIYCIVKRIKGE